MGRVVKVPKMVLSLEIVEERATLTFVSVAVLLLVGCGRDVEALDRFSRSSSTFLDSEVETSVASIVPLIRLEDNPNNSFWSLLGAALDPQFTNDARVQAASACLAAYDSAVNPYLDQLSGKIEELDKRVLDLIEIANTIHDHKYRADALEVAKSAREIQTNLAFIDQLLVDRFDVQRKAIVQMLSHAWGESSPKTTTSGDPSLRRMSNEIDHRRAAIAAAEQKYRNSLRALKGGFKHS